MTSAPDPPDAAGGDDDARASYAEGVGFGILSFVSVATIGLVSSIAIARIYGIETVGSFALALAPATTLMLVSSLREQTALVRELSTLPPRRPRITGLFAAVFAFSTALTLLIAALVLGGAWLVYDGSIDRPELFAPAVVLVAGSVLFENTSWNVDTVLTSFRAGRQLFWIRLTQHLGYFVAAAVIGLLVDSVWGLVAATVGAAFLAMVGRLLVLPRFMTWHVSREDLREGLRTLPELIRFGAKTAPGGIADGISQETATWTIGLMGTVVGVGAYNRAAMLGQRLIDVNFRIIEMLFPTLVERKARGDHAGFDSVLVDTLRYAWAGMLLPAAAGGGAAHAVMSIFGPGFDAGADALAVLLLAPAGAAGSLILSVTLLALDRPVMMTVLSLARMTVTIALSVALVAAIGITGAAIGYVVGFAVVVLWAGLLIRAALSSPLHELWPPRAAIAIPLAYAASFLTARFVDEEIEPLVPALVLSLGAGVVAYVAVLVLAGGLTPTDRQRVGGVVQRVRALRGGRPAGAEG